MGTRTGRGQGHGDGVDMILRTDLRRAMALVICRTPASAHTRNTHTSKHAAKPPVRPSRTPAFHIPHAAPHASTSRSLPPESLRSATFPHLCSLGIDSCVGHASPFLERAATCGIELNY